MSDRATDPPAGTESAFAPGLLEGYALAATLAGEGAARAALAPGLAAAVAAPLRELAVPDRKVEVLRAWAARTVIRVDAETLAARDPRARTLLEPLADAAGRERAAEALGEAPRPRRGFQPPAGLARALARMAPSPTIPGEAERGRGRRAMVGLGERAPKRLRERAGAEAAAIERLATLDAEAEPDAETAGVVPWAAMAASAFEADPVGRLGRWLAGRPDGDSGARELREMEAACRA